MVRLEEEPFQVETFSSNERKKFKSRLKNRHWFAECLFATLSTPQFTRSSMRVPLFLVCWFEGRGALHADDRGHLCALGLGL